MIEINFFGQAFKMLENHNHTETKTNRIEIQYFFVSFKFTNFVANFLVNGKCMIAVHSGSINVKCKVFQYNFPVVGLLAQKNEFPTEIKISYDANFKIYLTNFAECNYRSFCQSDCIGVRWLWNLQFNCHNSESRLKFD